MNKLEKALEHTDNLPDSWFGKSEIIILVGPPGSGKSTYCSTVLSSYYRISQDDMGKEEHFSIFTKQLALGRDIVIDRMNFSVEQRERYLAPAKAAGYKTKIIVFHVPFDTCYSRCVTRENHPTIKTPRDASKALHFFFRKYERVSDSEADEVIRLGWDGEKETAIICDLDGTLTNINHRMAALNGSSDSKETQKRDWKAFFSGIPNDSVNNWCAEIIHRFRDSHPIVYCSGRPDDHRKATEKWLFDNCLESEHLFMRRRNDFRKDDIIKEIILEFELKTRYDILFWLDDRKQVVDKIREHGIVVLQCCAGEY